MQFMYIYCILYMLKSNDSKVAYVNTDRQSGNLSFRLKFNMEILNNIHIDQFDINEIFPQYFYCLIAISGWCC